MNDSGCSGDSRSIWVEADRLRGNSRQEITVTSNEIATVGNEEKCMDSGDSLRVRLVGLN